jgi:hypothetical protein
VTIALHRTRLAEAPHAPRIVPIPKLHRGTALWHGLHVARTAAEREKIARHRYQVYIQSRGRDYPGLCHNSQMLSEWEDADAYLLYSLDAAGEISSSLRISVMNEEQIMGYEAIRSFLARHGIRAFRHGSVAWLARMCSSSQGGRDVLRLMMFGYYIALSCNIQFAFLTARPELSSLYERLGYVLLAPAAERGGTAVLSLFGASMTDYTGFLRVGSPYARIIDMTRPRVRLQHLAANSARTVV